MQKLRPPFEELVGKKDLVGAEIGVAGGKNALSILTHLNIKRLYLIDAYRKYMDNGHGVPKEPNIESHKKDAYNILKDFNDKIVWIVELSENAIYYIYDELDFVYIDANHIYEYVKKDIELYYSIVKDGGLVAGHDYKKLESGVIKAVNEFFGEGNFNVEKENWWILK